MRLNAEVLARWDAMVFVRQALAFALVDPTEKTAAAWRVPRHSAGPEVLALCRSILFHAFARRFTPTIALHYVARLCAVVICAGVRRWSMQTPFFGCTLFQKYTLQINAFMCAKYDLLFGDAARATVGAKMKGRKNERVDCFCAPIPSVVSFALWRTGTRARAALLQHGCGATRGLETAPDTKQADSSDKRAVRHVAFGFAVLLKRIFERAL
jgi:hypothetical protein